MGPRSRRTRTTSSPLGFHDAGENVGLADEIGDEGIGRGLVDLVRQADLLQPALVHDGDAVGHDQRLFLVMRDEQRGQPEAALQAAHLELHLLAQLAVERAERLVEQQQPRLEHGGAGERDALLLAARKLLWQALGHAVELDHLQGLRDPLGDLRFCPCAAWRADRRRCGQRSCAGTGRSSGTPCRCCAARDRGP